MRPILTYYGGKQRMAHHIVPIIERIPHKVYVEPFAGGAAILFAKDRPEVSNQDDYREYLNDKDDRIAALYRVCRDDEARGKLLRRLEYTEYGSGVHAETRAILKSDTWTDFDMAWTMIVQAKMSFAGNPGNAWGTSILAQDHPGEWKRLKMEFPAIMDRISDAYISQWDGVDCIQRLDGPDTLFYVDPPYVGTNQGHYKGYTEAQYDDLLECLGSIKGKFLLSGYPNEQVPTDWPYVDFKARMTGAPGKARKRDDVDTVRIERVWSNTPMETLKPESVQMELFAKDAQ